MYVVIAGGGKVGEYLSTVLLSGDNEVAIIEQDAQTADRLSVVLQGSSLVILGDGCDSKYQEDAGIRRADVFVATTGQDDNNLVACEIAQRVFSVPRCIARVNNPRNMRIFREIGIESISSTELIAGIIEEEALMGSMSVVNVLSHGNVVLSEITVPRMRAHDGEAGVAVGDIELPENSLIVAVSTADDTQVASSDMLMHPGDKAIVAADSDALDEVRLAFRSL